MPNMSMSTRWLSVVVGVVVGCGGHNNGTGNRDAGGDANSGFPDASIEHDAGSGSGCGLITCQSAGAQCGPIGDGCGGIIQCGSCPTGQTCGGSGVEFQCGTEEGSGSCTPRTCAEAGADCGIVSDGCGGVTANCGTCGSGTTCGGGGSANVCGVPPCTSGLCLQQMACTGMAPTTITGTVTAPGHDQTATWGTPDPIYNALVYIPNGSAGSPTYGVQPFPAGVSCDTCSSLVTGNPLISTLSAVDGTFTLTNAPCGTDIPIVIQLGRWRRQLTIPSVACCANTALTNYETHLPRDQVGSAGDVRSDIPLMAFSTGDVDTLHCVLRQIGIADTEFTNPTGTGRVRFYVDNGAVINSSTPAASTLYGSAAELDKYDMVFFECVGGQEQKSLANQQNVINYANAGGRIFATHYSYVWLTNDTGTVASNTAPAPWYQTAQWEVNQSSADSATGLIDTTLQNDANTQTRRQAFAQWLKNVGASTTLGQITVNVVRNDFNSVSSAAATMTGAPAQRWIYTTSYPLHYTFDTPIAYSPDPPPTTQCGRVLYSDFHVSDATSGGDTFPSECTAGKMTPQEKTLEFMMFDLASCVGSQVVTCTPKTCADFGYDCGETGDGCDDGIVLNCGQCPMGQQCGGGGVGVCGTTMCTPLTCADENAQCGYIGDGCGSAVFCGACPTGQVCGGNGSANQCSVGIE